MILGICKECEESQEHHVLDVERRQFYCEHNQVWAIRGEDDGYLLRWPVTRETFELEQENAKRLAKRLTWNMEPRH